MVLQPLNRAEHPEAENLAAQAEADKVDRAAKARGKKEKAAAEKAEKAADRASAQPAAQPANPQTNSPANLPAKDPA